MMGFESEYEQELERSYAGEKAEYKLAQLLSRDFSFGPVGCSPETSMRMVARRDIERAMAHRVRENVDSRLAIEISRRVGEYHAELRVDKTKLSYEEKSQHYNKLTEYEDFEKSLKDGTYKFNG